VVSRYKLEPEERLERIEERLAKLEANLGQLVAAGGSNRGGAFPEPLARALGGYGSAATHSVRFMSLLDAGEIAIMYSHAIGMAFAPEEAVARLFQMPPTLGSLAADLWRFLNDASTVASTDPVLQALRRSFCKGKGKPTPVSRYLLEEFVHIRNEERGHAAALPEGAYESLCRQVEPALLGNFKQCEHLRLHFVRVESVNIGKADWFEYSVTLLTGVLPVAGSMPVISRDRIRKGAACLWDGAWRLLALSPLVEYIVCSKCGLEHCFFLECADSQGLHLHSYTANHRMVLPGTLERL
jgi:hypothetical protein